MTRVSKFLGDCKVGNIEKEVQKLRAMDTKALESEVADLRMQLAVRNDEVEDLQKQLKPEECGDTQESDRRSGRYRQ